jgi:hypothetical protein
MSMQGAAAQRYVIMPPPFGGLGGSLRHPRALPEP